MIAILPYQRAWPEQFGSLGRELRNALRDLALRIDHIGWTSVPGLAAKGVLDIQVTTGALTTEVDDAVARAGYERLTHITRDHVPPGGAEDPEQWRKWFYNQRGDGRRVNLHVRVAIKDPVCDVTMGGAEDWAATTGWVFGPSDQ